MICRIQLVLEANFVLLPQNYSMEDGHLSTDLSLGSSLITVNGVSSSYSFHVCHNDILVIDVVNHIPDRAITVHWRGQRQHHSPIMDGVSMITQCPINSYSTFQYKFRASDAGTHMWQVQGTGTEHDLGGMFVVRQSERKDPNQKFYDFDHSNHSIWISFSNSGNILLNGLSNAKLNNSDGYWLQRNRRYRFRVAYAGGAKNCPLQISVDDHKLLLLALDGNAIKPISTALITLASGERIDFVFHTNEGKSQHRMNFELAGHCNSSSRNITKTSVTLHISETGAKNTDVEDVGNPALFKIFSTVEDYEQQVSQEVAGLYQAHAVWSLPESLSHKEVDVTIYLPFHHALRNTSEGTVLLPSFANISFRYPPSPLISQIGSIPDDITCNSEDVPPYCTQTNSTLCQCVHLINLFLGSRVELILSHHGPAVENSHVFHLHGNKFFVMSRMKLDNSVSPKRIKELNRDGSLLVRNFQNPVLKDTIAVPSRGVVALRFLASNSGYWMLRESNSDRIPGMEVVFHVGDGFHPQIPEDFPKCGNFIGPKYFMT